MFKRIGIVTKGEDATVLQAVDAVLEVLRQHASDYLVEGLSPAIWAASLVLSNSFLM